MGDRKLSRLRIFAAFYTAFVGGLFLQRAVDCVYKGSADQALHGFIIVAVCAAALGVFGINIVRSLAAETE